MLSCVLRLCPFRNYAPLLSQDASVLSLTAAVDAALGRLIFTLFAVNVVRAASGLHLGTSIFNGLPGRSGDGHFKPVIMLYGASDLAAAASSIFLTHMMITVRGGIYCMFHLTFCPHDVLSTITVHQDGQSLSDAYKRTLNRLQLFAVEASGSLTDQESAQLAYLTQGFDNDSPVRSMGTFNLNFPAGASLGGLIFTYSIILLQFKIGETK